MTDLVDPVKLLQNRMAASRTQSPELATDDGVPYEVPLQAPAGARLERLTIASTYRAPIPVLFDPATRTTYPISSEG